MEEGEDHLATPHPGPFFREGLLDLQDHVGACPHLLRGAHHFGTRPLIEVVGEAAVEAGALLDENLMAGPSQGLGTRRYQ